MRSLKATKTTKQYKHTKQTAVLAVSTTTKTALVLSERVLFWGGHSFLTIEYRPEPLDGSECRGRYQAHSVCYEAQRNHVILLINLMSRSFLLAAVQHQQRDRVCSCGWLCLVLNQQQCLVVVNDEITNMTGENIQLPLLLDGKIEVHLA